MRIEPSVPKNAPVGLLISPSTIMGEWKGSSWESVPREAKLYVANIGVLLDEIYQGNGKIRMWKNDKLGGQSRGYATSLYYHGHNIFLTRGALDGLSNEDGFEVLRIWADFFRFYGANPSSIGGAAKNLWKATLPSTFIEKLPGDLKRYEFLTGARQGLLERGTYEDAEIWDIRSAYPFSLNQVAIPRRWYRCVGWDIPQSAGFVRAEVRVPYKIPWGPLPIRTKGRMVFPVGEILEGVWTIEEIRAAIDIGCKVTVNEVWVGRAYRYPFQKWWEIIKDGRTSLSGPPAKMLKAAANAFWGSFASSGQSFWEWYENGQYRRGPAGGKLQPLSPTIAAFVSSRVRARLFNEALSQGSVISCHTDGVISQSGASFLPSGTEPGLWRNLGHARQVEILSPQVYRYLNENEELIYSVAGCSFAQAKQLFDRYNFRFEQGRLNRERREDWDTIIMVGGGRNASKLSRSNREMEGKESGEGEGAAESLPNLGI